jgi:hypothetical protein
MMAPALFPLVLIAASPQFADARASDPAVQVWLDEEARYERGDQARVFARTARDGYLVVLHADTEGRVRVLFPLDPWLDDFVRGGEGIELRTRGDREAFLVEERDGSGIVLAAWSAEPFRFEAFVRGDHWDYRAIAPEGVRNDPEAALLDIVYTMADGRRYEYDVAPYLVGRDTYDRYDRSPVYVAVDRWKPRIDWRVGFGTYSGFYLNVSLGTGGWRDPWFYDPWYHDAWWNYGPRYRIHYPIWYRPIHYDPYYYEPIRYRRAVVWDPFYWRHQRRHPGPGIGVHIRYAGGDCWGSWSCRRDPFPRPGRATGIALGAGDAGWPYGRVDNRDPRPGGIGRGTAQPRGGTAQPRGGTAQPRGGNPPPLRASDPQQDLGRERTSLRGIGERAAVPVATSTEIAADPRRSSGNGNGIGRRAVEPPQTGDPGRVAGTRAKVIEPAQSGRAERAASTGQSRDSRSIGDRARSSDGSGVGTRSIDPPSRSAVTRSGVTSRAETGSEPPSRSSISRSGITSRAEARAEPPARASSSPETARGSEPQNRSSATGTRIIGSSSAPPARSEPQNRSSATGTRIIGSSSAPPARSEPQNRSSAAGTGINRSSAPPVRSQPPVRSGSTETARSTSGRAAAGSARSAVGRASSSGSSSRVGTSSAGSAGSSRVRAGGTSGGGTSRIGGSSSRASSTGSARSSGGIGSRARSGGGKASARGN